MSRFSGPMYRGAGRAERAVKRDEAKMRLAEATIEACSHRHTFKGALLCYRRRVGQVSA